MDAVHLSRDVELERVTAQTTQTVCLVWCVERAIARKIKGLEVEQTAVSFFLMNSNQVKTCQQSSFMLLCDSFQQADNSTPCTLKLFDCSVWIHQDIQKRL